MVAPQPLIVSTSAQSDHQGTAIVSPQHIRQVILSLLSHCDVSYTVESYDQELHDLCLAFCKERGYSIGINSSGDSNPKGCAENEPSWLSYLKIGVYLSSIMYSHLKTDVPRLTYIALYASFIIYSDDLFKRDTGLVASFGTRLIRGEKQGHPVLNALADLLNDSEMHFGPTGANIIFYDTVGYFTSLLLDYETPSLKWSRDAEGFPHFMRRLSGLPSAFTVFIFPKDIPLTSYIQSVAEMGDFLSYMNDVLSFYKEELEGEEEVYISLVASSQGISKNVALQKLADHVAKLNDQIDKILKGDSTAHHVWSVYKAQFVSYHMSCPRYKMGHLNLL